MSFGSLAWQRLVVHYFLSTLISSLLVPNKVLLIVLKWGLGKQERGKLGQHRTTATNSTFILNWFSAKWHCTEYFPGKNTLYSYCKICEVTVRHYYEIIITIEYSLRISLCPLFRWRETEHTHAQWAAPRGTDHSVSLGQGLRVTLASSPVKQTWEFPLCISHQRSLDDIHRALFRVLNMGFTKGRVNSFRMTFLKFVFVGRSIIMWEHILDETFFLNYFFNYLNILLITRAKSLFSMHYTYTLT